MTRSEIAEVKRCANWLMYCLKIGWAKSQLDYLDHLWWEHHKLNNCPICTLPAPDSAATKENER